MSTFDFNTLLQLLNQLHFTRPWVFLALLVLPIVYWLLKPLLTSNQWARWVANPMLSLLVQMNSRAALWKRLMLINFFLFGVVALAGPALHKKPNQLQKSPPTFFIVLDMSLSMLAKDELPSRIGLARFKIIDILNQHPDALASLIVYAGSAHKVIPVTEDHQTIISQLAALTPEIMPAFGSNPLQAIQFVADSAKELKLQQGTVIWLTDHASNLEILQASKILEANSLKLKLLMIGTETGASITLKNGRQLLDDTAQVVIAKTPIQLMRSAANNTQTEVLHINQLSPSIIHSFTLAQGDSKQSRNNPSSEQWQELGFWLIPLLLLSLLPVFRRHALCLLMLLPLAWTQPAKANWKNWWFTPDQQGQQLFEQKKYRQALNTFNNSHWRIASQYRTKQFELAAQNYTAVKDYYNAGNAFAHAGQIDKALAAYQTAIKQNPNHQDAKHNHKILQQLLEQQQSSEQQDSKQQNGDAGEQQDGDSQQQSSEQQEQGKQTTQTDDQSEQTADNSTSTEQDLNQDKSYLQQPSTNQQQTANQQTNQQTSQQEQQLEDEQQDSTTTDETTQQTLTTEQIQIQETAMQYRQWLRTLPDNPSLLLQRKFDYQYKQRQQNAPQSSQNW